MSEAQGEKELGVVSLAQKGKSMSFFFFFLILFIYLFVCLFIYVCIGSSLPHTGFL